MTNKQLILLVQKMFADLCYASGYIEGIRGKSHVYLSEQILEYSEEIGNLTKKDTHD